MCVGISILGSRSIALLDTGCRCSVLDHSFLSKLDPSSYTLDRPTKSHFRTANNGKLKSIGTCKLPFKINNESYQMKFNVLQGLTYNLILGVNFVEKYNKFLDFGRQIMGTSAVCTLKPEINTHIAPNSIMSIKFKNNSNFIQPNHTGIVEKSHDSIDSLHVVEMVTTVENNSLVAIIENKSENFINIDDDNININFTPISKDVTFLDKNEVEFENSAKVHVISDNNRQF